MATVTKGKTFITGETVEPADLHQLVDSATVTEIVNADIKSDAAIAGTKIAPNFGSQNVVTTGNVGIGTSSPDAKCEVTTTGAIGMFITDTTGAGTAVSPNLIGIRFRGFAKTERAAIYATDEASNVERGQLAFYTQNSGGSLTEKMRIDASGRVGIGTKSPVLSAWGQSVTINSASGSNAAFELAEGGTLRGYISLSIGGGLNVFGHTGNELRLGSDNVARVRVKSTGQVHFVPLASDPAGAEAGDVYYNSATNKLKVYNGTSWLNLH